MSSRIFDQESQKDKSQEDPIFVKHLIQWEFLTGNFGGKHDRWFSKDSQQEPITFDSKLLQAMEQDASELLKLIEENKDNTKDYVNALNAALNKIGEKINNDLNIDPAWRLVPAFEYLLNPDNILDSKKGEVFSRILGKERFDEIKQKGRLDNKEELSMELETKLRTQFFRAYLFKVTSFISADKNFQKKNEEILSMIDQSTNLKKNEVARLILDQGSSYYSQFFDSNIPGHQIQRPERGRSTQVLK